MISRAGLVTGRARAPFRTFVTLYSSSIENLLNGIGRKWKAMFVTVVKYVYLAAIKSGATSNRGAKFQLDGVRVLAAHVSGEVFGLHNLDAKNAREETVRAKPNLTLCIELSLHIMLGDWSKVRAGGRLRMQG